MLAECLAYVSDGGPQFMSLSLPDGGWGGGINGNIWTLHTEIKESQPLNRNRRASAPITRLQSS